MQGNQRARAGRKAARRVLRVDAAFDGVTAHDEVLLLEGDRLTRRDAKLLADEVNAGDLLGDRMLDLNAGVHLAEIEVAVLVNEKLDGARTAVADALGQRNRRARHFFAQLRRYKCGRAFLDELLVAALYRALALEQVHHVAEAVAEDLHLDMARIMDIFFHIQTAVAEIRNRLGGRAVVGILEILDAERHANTLAAAAGRGLEHNGIADTLGLADGFVEVTERAVRAQSDRNAGRNRVALGFRFVAHQADGRGGRADKGKTCLRGALGEVRVFRQKAEARMNGLTAGRNRRRNDVIHVEIAVSGACGTDADRLVCNLRMERLAVGLGINRYRNDAEVAARLYDANCDFAAVRDEYLLKHSLNPALVHDYHALDFRFRSLLVADPGHALCDRHRAAALGEVHLKAQRVARLCHGAELRLVDAGIDRSLALELGHGEQCNAACLRKRLQTEHRRHDRVSGEMSLEEEFVARQMKQTDDMLFVHLNDFVNEKHRRTVRKNFHDLFFVQHIIIPLS